MCIIHYVYQTGVPQYYILGTPPLNYILFYKEASKVCNSAIISDDTEVSVLMIQWSLYCSMQ